MTMTGSALDDRGSGPAVVLLHAGIADRRMWHGHLEWLAAAGRRAVAPDLPGFGDEPAGPTSPTPWDHVLAVMDGLGIDRAALVGCSFGGDVAVRAAALAPERVSGLMLVSSPALGLEPSPQLEAVWDAVSAAMEAGDIDAAVAAVIAGWLPAGAPAELRELVDAMARRAFELQADVDLDDLVDPLEQRPELLAQIRVPAVVAVGEHDMPDFHWCGRTLAGALPGAVGGPRVIAGAGHLAPLEAPEGFAALLRELLELAG